MDYSLSKSEKELINFGDYYSIVELLEKMHIDIKLYDNLGYSIDDNRQLARVKKMKKYLSENTFSKNEYKNCINEVCNRIK